MTQKNSKTIILIMNQIPLSDYVAKNGQTATARRAGITQGAIWQMLKSPRQIFVTENKDGTVYLEEIKPIRRKENS